MVTGYEAGFYRDVERVRNAAERLANIETCRYLNEILEVEDDDVKREALLGQLATYERRVLGGR